MTYKESYMKCETLEDLIKEVKSDIATAYIINPDRFQVIKKAFEEVANLKFKDEDIEKFNWDIMKSMPIREYRVEEYKEYIKE